MESFSLIAENIQVIDKPNSTYYVEPDMVLKVGVNAQTDVDWQKLMKYEWLWYKPVKNTETGETILGNPSKDSLLQTHITF